MTEIKLDINTALLMLGKTREEYEEKKKDIKTKDCIFNKKNVEKIHESILSQTEKYFGFPLKKNYWLRSESYSSLDKETAFEAV